METIERYSFKPVDQLHADPIPAEAQYLWSWFADLNSSRQSNGFGPSPISYLDLQAWASLKRISLDVFEVEALKALDSVYLNSSNKDKKKS